MKVFENILNSTIVVDKQFRTIPYETNFANAQDIAPDSDYMNIQENNTNLTASEWINCNTYDSTYTAWTEVGDDPYLDAQDQPNHYIVIATDGASEGWFNFPNTFLTGSLTVNISIYCRNVDGNFLEDDKWPTITSKSHDVKPNSAIRDQITLTENGFPKDVYLCMIIVYNAEMVNDVTEINKNNLDKRGLDYPVYESKQIFFQIRN